MVLAKLRQSTTWLVVSALAATLALGGCGAWTESATTAPPASAVTATASPTQAPSAEPTARPRGSYTACDGEATSPLLLRVRDVEGPDKLGGVLNQLNTEFERANPGVTLARDDGTYVRQSPDDDNERVFLLSELAGPDAPDVVELTKMDTQDLVEAVEADLLLPLTNATQAYGWDDRWAPRTLDRMRFTGDGRRRGSGTLYGVPMTGSLAGLVLNEDVARMGPARADPTTLEEDMADFAAIRKGGVTPMMVAVGIDGDMAVVYGSILGSLVTPEWLDDFVYGRSGATFVTPETIAAARMLVSMADKGFFQDGYERMGGDSAFVAFDEGRAQYLAAGNWALHAIKMGGGRFTIRLLHPATAGRSTLPVGDTGPAWSIRKTSANADCAAAYLDWITSDHAMELIAASEWALPSHVSAGAFGPDPWYRDMALAYRDAESTNRLGHYLEDACVDPQPEVGESGSMAFEKYLAKLMARQLSPKQFVTAVERAYQACLATQQ